MELAEACTILGVAESTPVDEARKRYRMRAQMLHPDRAEPAWRDEAVKAMSELTEAWSTFQEFAASPNVRRPAPSTPTRGPLPGECYLCGRQPAGRLQLRSGRGLIIFRRTAEFDGEVCRDCGLSVFREFQAATLTSGWWGIIAFFANIAYVIGNIDAIRRHVRRVPSADRRDPLVVTPFPPGLPVSRPVMKRLGPLIGMTGAAGVVIFVVVGSIVGDPGGGPSDTPEQPASTVVGKCLTGDGYVADCSGQTGAFRIVAEVPDGSRCAISDEVFTADDGRVICAQPMR